MQQTNIINMKTNKYELQKKYRLGTVSKMLWFYRIPISSSAAVMAQNI